MDFDRLSRLGESIDRTWARFGYDTEVFSDIAHDALLDAAIGGFDLSRFAAYASTPRHLRGRPSEFGDARVVAFDTPGFSLEVLVWHLGSTSIHEHAFRGAFQVLHGSSIHGSYRFHEAKRVSNEVRTGAIEPLSTELLTAGAVRRIIPGRQGLCHSLFHLDAPSCSLVVRTPGEPAHFPQLAYFPPDLALATQSPRDPILQSAHDCISAARRLRDDDLQLRTIAAAVRRLDLFQALTLVVYLPPTSRALRRRILREIPVHFGELEDIVRRVIERQWLISDCIRLRSTIHEPDQRFILAAAVNVPTAEALRSLVEAYVPGQDPFEFVCRQASALMDAGRLSVAWGQDARDAGRLLRSFFSGEPEGQSDDIGALLAQDSVLRALRPITQHLSAR